MKKLLLLSIILLSFSCDKEEDGCTCKGEFAFIGSTTSFYGTNVDCDTGEPVTSRQGDEVYYKGCAD